MSSISKLQLRCPGAEVIDCLFIPVAGTLSLSRDGWSLAGTVHLMLGACGDDLSLWTLSGPVGAWAGALEGGYP